MSLKIYILTIGAVALAYSSDAQQIITDRPDQTEASSTIPAGSVQIESGALIISTEDGYFRNRQIVAPTTLFRISVIDAVELRVLNQYEFSRNKGADHIANSSDGFSDLQIGTKIQIFRKEDVNTEIAVLSHLILPTGSDNLTINEYGTINKLSISHGISDAISVGYNFGYDFFGEGDGNATYSLALGFGITDKVSVFIEPYGAVVEFEDHEANFDAGITYLLNDNLQLDYSFGVGINHDMNFMSAGFSWLLR
ncbi:MAG: transporter [Bacteroidia bacterium]|nr:transporter [Bacteroidia bacterium]